MRTLIRKHGTRMACMREAFDADLYKLWLQDQTQPMLDYPEWLIQRDNPGVEIPGITWGALWAGWTSVYANNGKQTAVTLKEESADEG